MFTAPVLNLDSFRGNISSTVHLQTLQTSGSHFQLCGSPESELLFSEALHSQAKIANPFLCAFKLTDKGRAKRKTLLNS